MEGHAILLEELHAKLNPIITEKQLNNSDYMRDEIAETLYEIVKKEAYKMIDITNRLEYED